MKQETWKVFFQAMKHMMNSAVNVHQIEKETPTIPWDMRLVSMQCVLNRSTFFTSSFSCVGWLNQYEVEILTEILTIYIQWHGDLDLFLECKKLFYIYNLFLFIWQS